MNTFKIKLGKTYNVPTLTIRKAKEVRKIIGDKIEKPLDGLRGFEEVELTDIDALSEIIFGMKDLLIDSMDIALDIVCDYSEEIKADRDEIEDTCTDEDVVVALIEVMKKLYPFGKVKSLVSTARIGRTVKT